MLGVPAISGRRTLPSGMMAWGLCLLAAAGSVGLSRLAAADTAGRAFPICLAAGIVLGLCWRGFERVLWMRFPTEREHTSAGRWCAWVSGVLLVAHGGLVAAGL